MPPIKPMLAKSVKGIPDPAKHGGLSFEPKWDGFRCLVFKDGDDVVLASRNTKPLTRYFPEVVDAMREQLPEKCVLDGELFVALRGDDGADRLEFEVLQERIHPAASRINMLAEKTPAGFVAFDLLALGDDAYVERPFTERRGALESALGGLTGPCYLTRTTTDAAEAEEWFTEFEGAGLDGVVAKPLGASYQPNVRSMLKVKHERTADVVVAGYREHKTSTPERPLLGSLLLGLYADGKLQHIGVSASFTEARRAELIEQLKPLVCDIAEHPWGEWAAWANGGDGDERGTEPPIGDREPRPGAGHAEPVERGQGPVVHAAAARPGDRGGLRPHGGSSLPAHRSLPALAHRPGSGVVRIRATRGAGELRPR
jgi:ATP-dependent DNA ligase